MEANYRRRGRKLIPADYRDDDKGALLEELAKKLADYKTLSANVDKIRGDIMSGVYGNEIGGGKGNKGLDALNKAQTDADAKMDEINALKDANPKYTDIQTIFGGNQTIDEQLKNIDDLGKTEASKEEAPIEQDYTIDTDEEPVEAVQSAGNVGDPGVYKNPVPARTNWMGWFDRLTGSPTQEEIDAGEVEGTYEYAQKHGGATSAPADEGINPLTGSATMGGISPTEEGDHSSLPLEPTGATGGDFTAEPMTIDTDDEYEPPPTPKAEQLSTTPTQEAIKQYIDDYYASNPNIQKTSFNDGILGATFTHNFKEDIDWWNGLDLTTQNQIARGNRAKGMPYYSKPPSLDPSYDDPPPQPITEDNIPDDHLDAPIDNQPSDAGDSLIDKIGGAVADLGLEMGGGSMDDFNTHPQTHHDLHNDSKAFQDEQQQDASTDANTHNVKNKVGTTAPSYQGKHNRATKIANMVVDAVADSITAHLLHRTNRRRLLNVNANVNKYVDRLKFGVGMIEDPMGTAIKGLAGLTKSSLDGIDGQNVFEMLSTNGVLTFEEEKDIELKKMGLFRKKQSIVQSHFGTDANGDIYLKTAQAYLKEKIDGTFQSNKPNRMVLQDQMKSEMVFIKNPATIPFIIITIVLYKALHDKRFNIEDYFSGFSVVDAVMEKGLKVFFKQILKIDDNTATFGMNCLTELPQELITAFMRNIDAKTGLTNDERKAIDDYVKHILADYKRIYGTSFEKAVKSFQGNNMNLYTMLIELNTDDVLHNLAIQLQTADNIIWESQNNQGLFLGLFELASIHSKGMGDLYLSKENIGDNYKFEGVVRFMGLPRDIAQLQDPKLNAMLDMERNGGRLKIDGNDNVGLYRHGNNQYVVIKGSKMPTDLNANFENVAGSSDLLDTDRFKDAHEMINKAKVLQKKIGGTINVLGHSLGGTIASHLGNYHQSVNIDAYDPVFSKNKQTEDMVINNQHTNINYHLIDGSPISSNLEGILADANMNGYDIRGVLKKYRQKRHSSHSVMNFYS